MENQKFTEEEIKQIQSIRQTAQTIFTNIGQLHFQKNALESQIAQIEENHKQLIEQENTLLNSLREKYGEGALDLNTFEFIPDQNEKS